VIDAATAARAEWTAPANEGEACRPTANDRVTGVEVGPPMAQDDLAGVDLLARRRA